MNPIRPLVALALSVGAGAACGGGDESSPNMGETVWRTYSVANMTAGEPALELVDIVRIGDLERHGKVGFGEILGLELDEEGRAYVLDVQSARVYIFEEDGTPAGAIGKPGEGPGEFRYPAGMAWGPDGHLWICDVGKSAYSLFLKNGNFVEQRSRRTGGPTIPWPGRFDDHGRLYDEGLSGNNLSPERVLLRFASDAPDATSDTFPLPQYEARFVDLPARPGLKAWLPYSRRLVWLLEPDGHLRFAFSDQYQVFRREPDGDTTLVVSVDTDPRPVTGQERTAVIEEFRRYGASLAPDDVPPNQPVLDGFQVDNQGRLWVGVVDNEVQRGRLRIDVFGAKGNHLGSLSSDLDLRFWPPPAIRGNRILAVALGPGDVPMVVTGRVEGLTAFRP